MKNIEDRRQQHTHALYTQRVPHAFCLHFSMITPDQIIRPKSPASLHIQQLAVPTADVLVFHGFSGSAARLPLNPEFAFRHSRGRDVMSFC